MHYYWIHILHVTFQLPCELTIYNNSGWHNKPECLSLIIQNWLLIECIFLRVFYTEQIYYFITCSLLFKWKYCNNQGFTDIQCYKWCDTLKDITSNRNPLWCIIYNFDILDPEVTFSHTKEQYIDPRKFLTCEIRLDIPHRSIWWENYT